MLISVTIALSLPTLVSDGVTVFKGASSSSTFVPVIASAGDGDDPEGISDCRLLIDVVTTGETETGLDGSPWLGKDELSALGVASIAEGVGEGWGWEFSNASGRAPLTIAFSTSSRAN